jgi:hypothetical protein
MSPGPIDIDHGGLFATYVDDGADRTERIAIGRGDDGTYGYRDQVAAITLAGAPTIAATQSIDRFAEVFVRDTGSWRSLARARAPVPTWLGALATPAHVAWIGSQVEPGGPASIQRLLVGVANGDQVERATFTDTVEGFVLQPAPVLDSSGVTRTYLLRGLVRQVSSGLAWDHFDILEVDAMW